MKKSIKNQSGFIASTLTSQVAWVVTTAISLILLVLFSISAQSNFKNNQSIREIQDSKKVITETLEDNYKKVTSKINNLIQSHMGDSLSTLEDYEARLELIKTELPSVKRVELSSTPLNEINPEPFPAINFATLDQLKKTKSSEKDTLPEIHLIGQKDQYLNFVKALDSEKDWYLIISIDPSPLFKSLPQKQLSYAKISFVQLIAGETEINLKSWGVSQFNTIPRNSLHRIPNSKFAVKSEYIIEQSFLGNLGLFPAIMGTLASLMWVVAQVLFKLKQIKQEKLNKEKEKKNYIPVTPIHVSETNEDPDKENDPAGDKRNKQGDKSEFMLDKNIFRAYDIRGIVDESLTTEAVKLIGQAIGTENLNRGRDQIVVARDGRLSGPKLLEALIEGLIKSGNKVINIGAVPTGVLYFATHHLETGSGVMLTGSHNPPNYNGLKIMLNGETLAGKLITDLYQMILLEELKEGDGSVQEMDIVDDYIDHIASDIQLEEELKVVVDAGNGIGGEVGPQLLEEIGCEVIPLHCDVDGSFPNHHPDPSVPANLEDLMAAVKASDADIGIAFDGDADRLGVVTKEGEMIYSDRILMLFAKDILTREPGASIIFDVKCTGHLPKVILKAGGQPIIWKTGHSFMKAKLKETDAAMAGEMSGHFFFKERWFGFDDGIYSAARLLEILDQDGRPAKEIFDELPNSVSTPELNCKTAEGANYAFMDKFKDQVSFPDAHITTIDGIRADFADGWGLVRCSNTTPCLVFRFDADNEEALKRIKDEFKEQIHKVDENLHLPF